jgi:protein-disulfide isomerase
MSELVPPSSRTGNVARWRTGLDLLATVLMIGASSLLVWRFTRDPVRRGPATSIPQSQIQTALPNDPISLDPIRIRGNPNAPAVLIEYSDFQCRFCAAFARDTWPTLRDRYFLTGKLQVVFRHLPQEAIHPQAFIAAEALECAGAQKFWQMHDALFARPQELAEPDLLRQARTLDFDETRFAACLHGEMKARVSEDIQSGRELAVAGTPTFFLGGLVRDGKVRLTHRIGGARPAQEFMSAIDEITETMSRGRARAR